MAETTPKDDIDEAAPRRRNRLPAWVEIAFAVVIVALVQGFIIKPFGVPSQSMEQTLRIGDRIIVNRTNSTVHPGDIVVFAHGRTWQDAKLEPATNSVERVVRRVGDFTGVGPSNTAYTVKRVIGMSGDRVKCCDPQGRVLVNNEPLDEPYVFENFPFTPALSCTSSPRSSRCFPEIKVPSGNLLVLGDHRSQSSDSVAACRGGTEADGCAKFVPENRVVGPVVFRIWPLGTFGRVNVH